MPFKSEAQNRWAHTPAGTKALGGPAAVKEWEGATDYKHLPERKGYAQGGPVKSIDQDTGDHIPKGQPFNHKRMAGGGGKGIDTPKGGIGGHNDGHGIYATGGPVLKGETDKHYKAVNGGRNHLGRFLGTPDRFSSGRMPLGFPEEADTEENWSKPKGVGQTEKDDIGDCKVLKPILPRS